MHEKVKFRHNFRPPTCRGDEANGAPPGQLSRFVRIDVTDDAQEGRPSGERRWAVLYDAGCGFCTWLLSFVLRWDRAARLHPIALGRPQADDLLQALTPAERMASWHLISPTGERRSGGAAVAALLRVLPGGRTILVSDLSGQEIRDEKDSAQVVIKYGDARRGQVTLDVLASEVDDLASKGRKTARRGRRPKTEAA